MSRAEVERRYRLVRQAMDAHGVDAVVVCTNASTHHAVTRRCLQARKHALVEKPMALSLAEADGLIALAEARSLALGVNYDLRQSAQAQQASAEQ